MLLGLFASYMSIQDVRAQADSEERIELGLEYRPRSEFRYGYRVLRADTSQPSMGTAQRSRFTLRYIRSAQRFVFSIQDIRIWGEEDTRATRGWLQAFEAYGEFRLNSRLKLKVGRQQLVLGDQRIFAANNWRHQGGKHDLIRLSGEYTNGHYTLFGGFNRTQMSNLNNDYLPDFPFYKTILGGYVQRTIKGEGFVEALGFLDSYQNLQSRIEYGKLTAGGRIQLETRHALFTGALYAQGGRVVSGKQHRAWLGDANLRWELAGNYSIGLGVQLFSGDHDPDDDKSSAFLAQYGAFHRFNGKMDYTSRQVWLEEHPGILNPNIRQHLRINDRVSMLLETHLLGVTINPVQRFGASLHGWFANRFYAFENDLTMRWVVSKDIVVHVGYMVLNAFEGIQYLPSGSEGNHRLLSHFSFLQLTWKPDALNLFDKT